MGETIEPKSIGQQIKEARKECKITQEQLSKKSGISLFTIKSLERAKAKETGSYTLRQLQKALNIKFEL